MKDLGLMEFKGFSGYIRSQDDNAPILFRLRIDSRGELEFDLDPVPRTAVTGFINERWDGEGHRLGFFELTGKADDGTEFRTEDLQFNSCMSGWSNELGHYHRLGGSCLRGVFHIKLRCPVPKPTVRMRLKGFRNSGTLTTQCALGTVEMAGSASDDDTDVLTGFITVHAYDSDVDISKWQTDADQLLDHAKRVMSFASAAILRAPIVEYFERDRLRLVTLTQTRQSPSFFRVFHYLHQQPIFDAAVTSYFKRQFDVRNLFFAIEWFAMEATHHEVNLVNAMTALENLVASNLDGNDSSIMSKSEFQKTRRTLRGVINKCISRWSVGDASIVAEVVDELDERLADLNRRSLLRKITCLAERWAVPLAGIGEERIRKAKQARDRIVHRGHYYESDAGRTDELWEHVTVVRELVVRFVLTAIGYRGPYYSFIGGWHEVQFPPAE